MMPEVEMNPSQTNDRLAIGIRAEPFGALPDRAAVQPANDRFGIEVTAQVLNDALERSIHTIAGSLNPMAAGVFVEGLSRFVGKLKFRLYDETISPEQRALAWQNAAEFIDSVFKPEGFEYPTNSRSSVSSEPDNRHAKKVVVMEVGHKYYLNQNDTKPNNGNGAGGHFSARNNLMTSKAGAKARTRGPGSYSRR